MSVVSSRLTLTSFVPRQVMLETATHAAAVSSNDYNHKRKNKRNDENVTVMEVEDEGKKSKKKKSYKISNAVEDAFGTVKTQAFDRPSGDAISSKGKGREDLLRSIAAFLEGSGFVKTLSVFRSEARIEVNSREDACINLEDLFNKITESSRRDPVASLEWLKEQDVQTKDQRRKNKQVSDSFGLENSEKILLNATLRTEENIDYGKPLEGEKKKKRKAMRAENMGEVALLNVEEVVTKEKIEKLKDLASGDFEKDKGDKKKKKGAKLFLEQSELGVNQKVIAMKPDDGGAYASTKHQESANSVNLAIDLPENIDGNRKDKKKNKNKKLKKSALDSLHTQNSDKLVDETSAGVAKHDDDDLQKSGFIKESIAISNENTADVGTTSNKKRQRSSSKETTIQFENTTETSKSKQTMAEADKEGKEACESDQKNLTCSEPSLLNQKSEESLSTVVLDKHEEDSSLQDPLKQLSGHQLENGDIEKHQKEGSAKPKSMKKENHSVEPKGVNAFQRVKVDQVQFADERLQDNSYWALDDSGSGYGAKAQEVLGQVRGRDFRHEKTKKKRGTYRGGQINLQSNSIKFNYSDDE